MHIDTTALQQMNRIKRLNLVNSISGIKPANLIGTISNEQKTNLAIFSSIVHLGSNPALLGFISRPSNDVQRHTLNNIMENGYYTINHVHDTMVERAHYTSAKFDENVSEFEKCNFTEEYMFDFKAPFVKESQLKLGMQFLEKTLIKANNTILVIGEIKHIIFPDEAMNEEGHIDIGDLNTVGIGGLNHYYHLEKIASFPYARVKELPDFKK